MKIVNLEKFLEKIYTMKEKIFITSVSIAMILVVVWLIYRSHTLGGKESDYHTVCICGHGYYRANFAQKGFLSIRLNDDGTTAKCKQHSQDNK